MRDAERQESTEQSDILPEHLRVRTGRKEWKCESCGTTIKPGERHLEYLGEAHAYESGTRYCALCAENEWGMDAAYFFPPAASVELRRTGVHRKGRRS